MSIVNKTSILRVIALEISEDGAVSKKQMKIDRDSQLENTLLKADYPDIRVATIDIPQQQLDGMRPRNYRLTRAAAWPIAAPPPKPWV